MSIIAWRIVQAKLAGKAFDGEGARLYGGRWNHKGTSIVYTAGSISLAAIEMLVHLESTTLLESYLCVPVEFNESLCRKIDPADLPSDWTTCPVSDSTRDLGTAWIDSLESIVLAVPSVPVPLETNFLINPIHPDFDQLRIGNPEAFGFDSRLSR